MKGLVFGIGVLALGLAAVTPASADYAVVKFKDNGACRAWYDQHRQAAGEPRRCLWVKKSVKGWKRGSDQRRLCDEAPLVQGLVEVSLSSLVFV